MNISYVRRYDQVINKCMPRTFVRQAMSPMNIHGLYSSMILLHRWIYTVKAYVAPPAYIRRLTDEYRQIQKPDLSFSSLLALWTTALKLKLALWTTPDHNHSTWWRRPARAHPPSCPSLCAANRPRRLHRARPCVPPPLRPPSSCPASCDATDHTGRLYHARPRVCCRA
jgi:hypothetical protein